MMIQLTTRLYHAAVRDLDVLGMHSEGTLSKVWINSNAIVSFHAHPFNDEEVFDGTKIAFTGESSHMLVQETPDELISIIYSAERCNGNTLSQAIERDAVASEADIRREVRKMQQLLAPVDYEGTYPIYSAISDYLNGRVNS